MMSGQTKKLMRILATLVLSGLALSSCASQLSDEWTHQLGAHSSCGDSCDEQPASGCTVFTLEKGGQIYFGGNDDYITLDSYYWVDQRGDGQYGVIWVGPPDNVQQGVNEKGLAYDANGLPSVYTNPHPEREPVPGGYVDYVIHIMRHNSTVEEVIDWIQSHQRPDFMRDQLHFADASGDAVIVSPGQDGELIFTRKPPRDAFLISTNFNVADPNHGNVSWRYSTAEQVLGELIDRPGGLTPLDGASVLEAVHDEGSGGWTRSSMLADLPNGKVYLYYFYQFDSPVILDVADQLTNPPAPGPLSELFPQDVQEEAERRYQRLQSIPARCRTLGIGWFALVAGSLIGLAAFGGTSRTASLFWWLVVLILGPAGLAAWVISGRRGAEAGGQRALLEVTGDLTPTLLSFLLALIVANATSSNPPSDGMYLLLLIGMPLVVSLFAFHGTLLLPIANTSYLRLIWRRLPHVIVASILGVAGLTALAIPLAEWSASTCMVGDLNISTIGVIWASMAIGSLAAALLLFAYQAWATRRGFRAWSALGSADAVFSTPGWRQLWWWILLASGILFGSTVVNQYLLG